MDGSTTQNTTIQPLYPITERVRAFSPFFMVFVPLWMLITLSASLMVVVTYSHTLTRGIVNVNLPTLALLAYSYWWNTARLQLNADSLTISRLWNQQTVSLDNVYIFIEGTPVGSTTLRILIKNRIWIFSVNPKGEIYRTMRQRSETDSRPILLKVPDRFSSRILNLRFVVGVPVLFLFLMQLINNCRNSGLQFYLDDPLRRVSPICALYLFLCEPLCNLINRNCATQVIFNDESLELTLRSGNTITIHNHDIQSLSKIESSWHDGSFRLKMSTNDVRSIIIPADLFPRAILLYDRLKFIQAEFKAGTLETF